MFWGYYKWRYYVFLGLAFLIVYPDKVVEWIGERTGKVFSLRHVFYAEIFAIGLTSVSTYQIMSIYPRVTWWYPVLFVIPLALFRYTMYIIANILGFND